MRWQSPCRAPCIKGCSQPGLQTCWLDVLPGLLDDGKQNSGSGVVVGVGRGVLVDGTEALLEDWVEDVVLRRSKEVCIQHALQHGCGLQHSLKHGGVGSKVISHTLDNRRLLPHSHWVDRERLNAVVRSSKHSSATGA